MQNNNDNDQQKQYSNLLLAIGEGKNNIDADMQEWNKETGEQLYVISNLPFIHHEEDAINFIYPNGIIDSQLAKVGAFLAITNKDVDYWNKKIQQLNPNEGISTVFKRFSM